MKTIHALRCAALVLLIAGPAMAQNSAGVANEPSAQDQSFMRQAATDGATEVAINREALEHVQSPATKQMAQRLITDHTKANKDLAEIAKRNNVSISAQPDPAELAKARSMASMQGSAYDKAYAQAMVTDHQKAIQLFSNGTRSSNAEVSQFAQNTLPVLKEHLSMASALANGKSMSSMSTP